MKIKDYYLILGVSRDVGADEIKSAYRKLAHRYHPDVSSEPDSEDKFKEIGEAYETLKIPERRSAYDRRAFPSPGRRTGDLPLPAYYPFWGGVQWIDFWCRWLDWERFWVRVRKD